MGWFVVNYLDDFRGVEVWDKAQEAFEDLRKVIKASGLEESEVKACGPGTSMIFLGVLFDTIKLTLSVTDERLLELRELLKTLSLGNKKGCAKISRELHFVAKCVRLRRIFISRMLEFLRCYKDEGSRLVCSEIREDVEWWATFIVQYNVVSMMPMEDWSQPDEVVASDTCLVGGGRCLRENISSLNSQNSSDQYSRMSHNNCVCKSVGK